MDPVGIPNLWKDEEAKVPVLLRSTAGVAQTSVARTAVTAKFACGNDTALQSFAPAADQWTELGEGHYLMTFPSTVPDAEGPFIYQVATTATGNETFIANSRVELRPEDRVWDEAIAGHAVAGSTGALVSGINTKTAQLNFTGTDVKATLDGEEVALSAVARNAVVDAVWDEDATGHVTDGSMGDKMTDISVASVAVQAKTDLLSFTGTDVKATLDGEVVANQAHVTMRYDQSGAAACLLAWLLADGEVVTTPTSARVIVYDESDVVVIDSTSTTPDVYGFFKIAISPLTLTALKAHRVRVIIVSGGVTYESLEAFITFN